MRSLIRSLFTEGDREAIREATAEAEARTAGELVCYVVERCDPYAVAGLRGALVGALALALGAALAHELGGFWGGSPILWIALPPSAGAALGWALVRALPAVERRLIGTAVLERQVARRASAAFVEEEIFATRERTGILIFLALFEHRVLVVGDEGINRRVAAGAWDEICGRLAAGIRARRPAEAMIEAVDACGQLLEAAGIERAADDVNELDDRVRFHRE